MRNKLFFVFAWLCCGIMSCDSNQILDEYKSISDQWSYEDVVEFNFKAPDTINPYNLLINIRNTNDYKYNNLFLIVEMSYPHGKVTKDTLEYRMADPDGNWFCIQ